MFQKSNLNKLNFTIYLVLFTGLLGCDPGSRKVEAPNIPSPKQTQFSTLSLEALSCEVKLKKEMTEKAIPLQPVRSIENVIASANEVVAKTNQTDFSLKQKESEEVTELAVEHSLKSDDISHNIEYSLRRNESGKRGDFSLTIGFKRTTQESREEIKQTFQVLKDCSLFLTETAEEKVNQLNNTNYSYESRKHFVDGMSERDTKTFTLPENALIFNVERIDHLEDLPAEAYSYAPGLGVIKTQTSEAPGKNLTKFGLNLNFKAKSASFIVGDKVLITAILQEDKEQKVRLIQTPNSQEPNNWNLPYSIWKNQSISGISNANQIAVSKLSKEYLLSNSEIQLTTNATFNYPHMSAYWTVSEINKNNSSGHKSFKMTESRNTIYSDTASDVDLISNDTIQVDLPKIQEIAKEILKKEPTNRIIQTNLILKYLSENYQYDFEMIANNIVRPLTTEEALTRGKGVCQHYAVIYTAIARALKIPTRIVLGYALFSEGKPIAHAWNETEIRPGSWQVIEPQVPTALINGVKTRFYIPIARAHFLEDRKAGMGEMLPLLLNKSYLIEPAL